MTTNEENDTPRTELDEELLSGFVSVTRRELMGLVGGSVALAGLEGCARQPNEKIVPYVRAPEEIVPGRPLFYASTLLMGGYGNGVLVESHMGRPTKIEGNELHPASLGGTDAFMQASVRTLYDPSRSKTVRAGQRIASFEALVETLAPALTVQRGLSGAGLRIITPEVSSPTLIAQMDGLLQRFPQARWYVHAPVSEDNARAGARLAFARELHTHYRFDRAAVVVALDSDFLTQGPGSVRYARDFMSRRRVRDADRAARSATMNRLYVAEHALTLTGAAADHRLALSPRALGMFVRRLTAALGIALPEGTVSLGAETDERAAKWLAAVAKDLTTHRGASAIIPGYGAPPEVHALAHSLNHALGNVGKTVFHTEPLLAIPQNGGLVELVRDMQAGRVEVLVMLDGVNPIYDAPHDLAFDAALKKVPLRIHHGLYEDETSANCHWHVPASHELEAWSDARAVDGTLSIVQPLIAPLYASKSAHEVVNALVGEPRKSGYDTVRASWKKQFADVASFDRFWDRTLHDGVAEGSAAKPLELEAPSVPEVRADPGSEGRAGAALDVLFRPDPTIWDGRFANNAWLQELAKPISKTTWDNTIWMGPKTAARRNLKNGDRVAVALRGRSIEGPIWVVPGHVEDTITLFLGYGRTRVAEPATGVGYRAYDVRSTEAPWFDTGAELRPLGARTLLSMTQEHHQMEGRDLVRVVTRDEFNKPKFVLPGEAAPPRSLSLYPDRPARDGNAWGMSIDLSTCVGCSACVIACQAENNIPTVGPEQVRNGREMAWMRVDQYFDGPEDDPVVDHQPVICMHCETAPCEVVCPVGATSHSPSGLNEMTYNRCIGTRFCSHNCPYKVRRFNFLQFSNTEEPVLKLLMNPDVTVRSRGIMEKCSYCVQRINHARIDANKAGRPIRDGEVVTACEGACPAQAIVFGDLNDENSRVSRAKRESHDYGLLAELNTRPRTTYLAKVTNPNPELGTPERAHPHHGEPHGEHGEHGEPHDREHGDEHPERSEHD